MLHRAHAAPSQRPEEKLGPDRLELDDRRLVQICRLDCEADLARDPLPPLHELLLRGFRGFHALPQEKTLGAAILLVVEADIACEAVVLAQRRYHGLGDRPNRVVALLRVRTRERNESCVHRSPPFPAGRARSYDCLAGASRGSGRRPKMPSMRLLLVCLAALAVTESAAADVAVRATMTTSSTTAFVGVPWTYAVAVEAPGGGPADAKVKLQVLRGDRLVGCVRRIALVRCSNPASASWIVFRGHRRGAIVWPARYAGSSLTLRAVVVSRARRLGLDVPVEVEAAEP